MSSFIEPISPGPISPELALVSPELAAIARAALPDRPWEAFLPPEAEAAPLRPPTISEPLVVVQVAPAPEPVGSQSASRRRPRVPVGLILLAAFVGLVVVGSVLPVRDAPTLGPPPARANGLSVPQTPPPRPQGPQISTTPAPSTIPAVAPPRSTTTTVPTTTTPVARGKLVPRRSTARLVSTAPLVHPQARPQGRYVLARGVGLLRVGAGARSIAEIRANIGCGWEVVTKRISIASDGRFSARRVALGQVRSTITVTGVFARAGTVHGTIRVTKGRCVSGPIIFTGRLS